MQHKEGVESLSFSPSGELLATGSRDRTAVVWDVFDGEKIAEFQHDDWIRSVEFSPDGKYLASGSMDKTAVVWDVFDGEKIAEFQHSTYVESVAFSPDGKYLGQGGADEKFCVAEWKKRKCILTEHHGDFVWDISWFKRIPAYIMNGVVSPFAELPDKYDAKSMSLSRRGFLAIGDIFGNIEVIREGKDFIMHH